MELNANPHRERPPIAVWFVPDEELPPEVASKVIQGFTEYCRKNDTQIDTTKSLEGSKVNLYPANKMREISFKELGVRVGCVEDPDFPTVWQEYAGDVLPEHEKSQKAFAYLLCGLRQSLDRDAAKESTKQCFMS